MASNRIPRGVETFLASGGTEEFHQWWSPTSTHLFAQSPDHPLPFALANDCAWSTIRGRNGHTFFEVLSCIGRRFPFLAVTRRATSSNMWSATHLVLKRAQASVGMNRKTSFHRSLSSEQLEADPTNCYRERSLPRAGSKYSTRLHQLLRATS